MAENFWTVERRAANGDWTLTTFCANRAEAMAACDDSDDRRWRRRTYTPSSSDQRYILLALEWRNLQTEPPRHPLDIPTNLAASALLVGSCVSIADLESSLAQALHHNRQALEAAGEADSCPWLVVAERGGEHAFPTTRLVLNSHGIGVETVQMQTPLRIVRISTPWLQRHGFVEQN